MVVLRLGGAYADVDAECRQPLDSIIQPADTMLVGWDTEVSNTTSAAVSGLARQRLIANWFFVASAGHPVLGELCDHIARNAMTTFSNNTVRDTAERTGQAVWTDVVLRHALQHHTAKVGGTLQSVVWTLLQCAPSFMFVSCAVTYVHLALLLRPFSAVVSILECLLRLLLQHDDPWKVRILPRVAFGVRPMGDEPSLRPDSPGVVVLHHFMSSWQTARRRSLIQVLLSRDRWVSAGQPLTPAGFTPGSLNAATRRQEAPVCWLYACTTPMRYACSILGSVLAASRSLNDKVALANDLVWSLTPTWVEGLIACMLLHMLLQADTDPRHAGARAGQQHHPLPSQHLI
jgi:hypothetical protein